MNINVGKHEIKIDKTPINEKEMNVTECIFTFDEEMIGTKKALFTLNGNTYMKYIIDNKCSIPHEVLASKGTLEIGVVVEEIENETTIKRFNPSPDFIDTWSGSLKDYQNSEEVTPTDKEQIEQAITDLQNNKQDTLVSGENIKTINNESLLGSGNLEVITDLSDYYTKDEVDTQIEQVESEIPTKTSDLNNDSGFIDKDVDDLENYTKTSDLSKVATSGSYNDLEDTPNLSVYSLITETGAKIDLEINSSTYVLTAKLYDKNNNLLSTSTGIDLPLETMVVGASYDSETKEIILTLKNGQEVRFSVADLVSGLQTEITPTNKLASDLVDDTNQTHKFVSQSEKTQITTNATNIAGIKNGTTINSFSGVESALNGKEDKSNKVTSISSSSTDTQYPSAKCVYDSQTLQDNEISDLKNENDYLNSIINQLPKVSGTGENITLNNTIEAKMEVELNPSELEQETTTGSQLLKPLINTETKNSVTITNNGDGTYTLNGTPSANTYFSFPSSKFEDFGEAGTYYFSSNNFNDLQYAAYIDSATVLFWKTENGTFTLTDTVHNFRFQVGCTAGVTYNNVIIKPMINKGTTALPFEKYTGGIPAPNPQFPMPIHTISGNNKVVVCNKNLMSLGTQQNGYVDAGTLLFQDGSGGIGTAATKSVGYYFKTSQLPNTITISDVNGNRMNVCYFNEIPTYQSQCLLRSASNDNPRTINIDKTYKYVHIQFSYNDENVSNIQVESGSTKTDFVTSTFQEANINLGDIEYCEIGDYKDRIFKNIPTDEDYSNTRDEGAWYIKKNIGKAVLNGSESGGRAPTGTTGDYRFYLDIGTNIITSTFETIAPFYCDKFKPISRDQSYAKIEGIAPTDSNFNYKSLIIYSDLTKNMTFAEFQNWLSSNNVTVYYPYATSIYLPITGTLAEQLENVWKAQSKSGQTNISQVNQDLPFVINASALRDLSTL